MRAEAPGPESFFAEILKSVKDAASARAYLREHEMEEPQIIGLLRLALPVAFLEAVAAVEPWSDRPRVIGGVCLNPKTPRPLAQRLLPILYWRDLADVAASTRLEGGVRTRAEAILRDRLPDLRRGEKIALGRIATPLVLRLLLQDPDPMILEAALQNPRLTESELVALVRTKDAPRPLLEAVSAKGRWQASYAVKLALVLQPRTPAPVSLAQLTSLVVHDLQQIAENPDLPPLVQAAAGRVAAEPRRR
jgi:hypothetical protein